MIRASFVALALSVSMSGLGCMPTRGPGDVPALKPGSNTARATGGSGDTGGAAASGGSSGASTPASGGASAPSAGSSGGSPGSSGPAASGGGSGTTTPSASGGAPGNGGSSGVASGGTSGGSGGSAGAADAGGATPSMGADPFPGCYEPVFSGVMPNEFCSAYEKICGFMGANHYTSLADCMGKFKGGSNDGDACKSGHLCRAHKKPAGKAADCASAGTARCSN